MREKPVLVIDNDQSASETMEQVLEPAGFPVFAAGTAETGLALARKIKPVLVFVNLSTPGANGLEICKALQRSEELRDVPIVLLTMREGKFNPIYKSLFGICDFIKKPLDPEVLLSTVHSLMPEEPALEPGEDDSASEEAAMEAAPEESPDEPGLFPESAPLGAEPAEDAPEAAPEWEAPPQAFSPLEESGAEETPVQWEDEAQDYALEDETAEVGTEAFEPLEEPKAEGAPDEEVEGAGAEAEAEPFGALPLEEGPSGADDAYSAGMGQEVPEEGMPDNVSTPEEAAPGGPGRWSRYQWAIVPATIVAIAGLIVFTVFNFILPRAKSPSEVDLADKLAPGIQEVQEPDFGQVGPRAEPEVPAEATPQPATPPEERPPAESSRQRQRTPPPKTPSEDSEAARLVRGAYYVQFGAFRYSRNARELEAKLSGNGYDVFVADAKTAGGQTLHRVLLKESFGSRDDADRRAKEIKGSRGVATSVFTPAS